LIYVTSDAAARRVEAMVAELSSSELTSVIVVSPRLRRDRMQEIRQLIEQRIPRGVEQSYGIGREREPTGCPRVRIDLLPPGRASAELEGWAAGAVSDFGPDRVVVERYEGIEELRSSRM
jgi:hypothetical protein